MISEAIQQRMDDLGLSQNQLAERMTDAGCPVTRQAVSAWTRGESLPRLGHVPYLCDALGMSPTQRLALIDAARHAWDEGGA